ncbi:MAG: hypothetical protein ACOCYC_03545 [bacterium]
MNLSFSSSPVANGTNRAAVLMQNSVSAGRFYRQGKLEIRRSGPAAAASALRLIGAF